jgi:type IV pilus assembly protein PilC
MKFIYKAKDKLGNIKTGTIEARSSETAVRTLQSYDLVVLDISPMKKVTFLDTLLGKQKRISRKDLAIFLRQFATLLESQVPLGEALKTLLLQAPTPQIKDLVFELVSDLDSGLSLSKAVEKRGDVFGEFYSQMIKSGEISGRLEDVLTYLADYAEHENDLVNKAKSAASYPIFLFGTFIVVGAIITIALAPQMASIFEEFGKAPPIATRILISVGNFLSKFGILVIVVLLGLIWFLTNYFRSREGERILGVYLLKIPLLGEIYKKIFISRFCETAGTLIQGGIPTVVAFEVAGGSSGNYIYYSLGKEIAEGVKRGESISNILKNYYEYFPPLVSQMVAVGENTGRLDELLKKVAEYYQKEINRAFATLLDLLQPALVIVIGVAVGFLVAAVILPIYQLAQGV